MSDESERYVVVDHNDELLLPVVRYLKYLDGIGKARNTLKAYAHHLCLFFDFLDQKKLGYESVKLHDMSDFVLFLKNPLRSVSLWPRVATEQARANTTINQILTACFSFYDYLWRQGSLDQDVYISTHENGKRHHSYKSFLHHAHGSDSCHRSVLKQRTSTKRPSTLTKAQIETLVDAAGNPRDRLLLLTLFESSVRIGEALALWLEDINITKSTISICNRSNLENLAEIKTSASIRTIYVSRELINEIIKYVAIAHHDETNTNHLFLKMRGPCAGQALSYAEVNNLFQSLRKKTGIDASAHVLRHSSATECWRGGYSPEALRLRLGHENYQTTARMYVHPNDEDMSAAYEQVQERLMLKQLKPPSKNIMV